MTVITFSKNNGLISSLASKTDFLFISAQDRLDPELLALETKALLEEKKQLPEAFSKVLQNFQKLTKKDSNGGSEEVKEELSEEATKVLEKLHDLSYMRSSVLMFPVTMQEGVITSK